MNLAEVEKRHAYEREEIDAEYDAEQAQHVLEIKKRINKEHEHELKIKYKDLLEKVFCNILFQCLSFLLLCFLKVLY